MLRLIKLRVMPVRRVGIARDAITFRREKPLVEGGAAHPDDADLDSARAGRIRDLLVDRIDVDVHRAADDALWVRSSTHPPPVPLPGLIDHVEPEFVSRHMLVQFRKQRLLGEPVKLRVGVVQVGELPIDLR